jgi:hypothetical protein
MKILGAFLIAAAAALAASPSLAEDRVTLGWGRMFSNDAIGDGHDRWRTGGYQVSYVRGVSFDGALPSRPGELLEFRASSQILAPASLTSAAPGDRRYAGILSLGAHSQFDWQGNDVSLGGDLVITGPQTGISNFQKWIHNAMGQPEPLVVANQIENGVYPTFSGEIGRQIAFGDHVTLRPFAEAQAGVETFVRLGGDVVIGDFGKAAVMVRDGVTGQRYRAVESAHNEGLSLVMGADVARMFDSALLPTGGAAVMSEERHRLRAGMHWQGKQASVFYGVSYLSPEFETQPEGQVVGALNLNLKF